MKRQKEEKKRINTVKQGIQKGINCIIAAITILFLLNYASYAIWQDGYSMDPQIEKGSIMLVERFSYKISAPNRMDLVAFKDQKGKLQVKRIVGLPGETIQIKDGCLWINGQILEESKAYVKEIDIAGIAENPVILALDEYFVLGDNPSRSEDSRFVDVGNLSRDKIFGRVWLSGTIPFSIHFW